MRESSKKMGTARNISKALGLPRTAEKIIDCLSRTGRYLRVKELVKRVRMSERSVRKYLLILKRRGLLRRRAVQRDSRRVTYEYSLASTSDLLRAARQDLTRTLHGLEAAVRRLGRARTARVSPRSVSSSRN